MRRRIVAQFRLIVARRDNFSIANDDTTHFAGSGPPVADLGLPDGHAQEALIVGVNPALIIASPVQLPPNFRPDCIAYTAQATSVRVQVLIDFPLADGLVITPPLLPLNLEK